MASIADHGPAAAPERLGGTAGEIWRDVARGLLAGVLTGLLVGGVGGRLLMRLAALLVPDAIGLSTRNGAEIGAITLDGTVEVMFYGGLFGGFIAGLVWVAVSTWIPGHGIRRVLLTMPVAVGLSGFFLIEGDNPDFVVLRHDGLVVASYLGLASLFGFAIAWLDDVLERRLPYLDGRPGVQIGYAVLIAIGLLLFLPYVVVAYFRSPTTVPVGLALLVTALATVVWWGMRAGGQRSPPRNLLIVARAGLLTAVVVGIVALVPEVVEALGSG